MAHPQASTWVCILAGGVGSRFWPASTRERPKQLLPLVGDRPLVVDALQRARHLVDDERIKILAGAHLADPFRTVLDDFPEAGYWIEPRARGTAPALAWAAWKLARLDPEAVMVSLHADHLIEPVEAFRTSVESAVAVARREELLLSLGVRADRVETGYGHVEVGAALPSHGDARAFRVLAFHEKPDAETARRYVDEGHLWNTGIFVWKASVLLEELEHHAPEISQHLPLLEHDPAAFFDAVPMSVIDRAVMERSDRVGVVEATFRWDDVGNWEALGRTRSSDARGNVLFGDARVVEARNNIVYCDEGGSVVVFGARDLVVVRTEDTTLVLPRSRAGELKRLVARLEEDA
ncbi:MAG: sugar phosphate nucleotidyltransferase [Longimicrobiales bacterium]|nr:sugar phosphate nucleotidyltransferase [Longimicrobiales bacterium]